MDTDETPQRGLDTGKIPQIGIDMILGTQTGETHKRQIDTDKEVDLHIPGETHQKGQALANKLDLRKRPLKGELVSYVAVFATSTGNAA